MRWYERNLVRCGRHGTLVEITPEMERAMRADRRSRRWKAIKGFPLRVLRLIGRMLLR